MSELRFPFVDMNALSSSYREEMEEAVMRVVRSGRYVGGDEVESFENQLSKLMGAKYAVGVSNGLDALRLIFRALMIRGDLKEGDEVIVPANTYIASVLPLVEFGLTPVLAEPDINTLNLDTERLDRYLSPRTRAILPVHLYGRAVWDEKLKQFAEKHNLIIVEDNAQAIGAKAQTEGLHGSRMTGALGHAGAFSFYPTKNVGALGDAGAVVTHDAELAQIVRALANYGSDRRYHNIYAGYNCRLDPIQAAVLKVKLNHLEEETSRRIENASTYHRYIANDKVIKPLTGEKGTNVWHQYVVRVDNRDEFRNKLLKCGVATDIHYATPPHLQPCLKNIVHGHLPVTELIADTVVSLPITSSTSVEDVRAISEIINRLD